MPQAQHKKGLRSLNWLNFFAADISTGVGPFLAVFLTANQHWKAAQIGIVLASMSFAAAAGAYLGRCRRREQGA